MINVCCRNQNYNIETFRTNRSPVGISILRTGFDNDGHKPWQSTWWNLSDDVKWANSFGHGCGRHDIGQALRTCRPFRPHRMMPWKFRDDISNGSGVTVLTDKQTDRQTDTTENNSTLAATCGHVQAGNIHETYPRTTMSPRYVTCRIRPTCYFFRTFGLTHVYRKSRKIVETEVLTMLNSSSSSSSSTVVVVVVVLLS